MFRCNTRHHSAPSPRGCVPASSGAPRACDGQRASVYESRLLHRFIRRCENVGLAGVQFALHAANDPVIPLHTVDSFECADDKSIPCRIISVREQRALTWCLLPREVEPLGPLTVVVTSGARHLERLDHDGLLAVFHGSSPASASSAIQSAARMRASRSSP